MATMFKRSFASSRDQNKISKPPSKVVKPNKRSFTQQARAKLQQLNLDSGTYSSSNATTSPVITLVVGSEARLFACHADVLSLSPYFAGILRNQFYEAGPAKRIDLPDEEPEVFSAILEYLYKGDYYPRLVHEPNRLKRDSWSLEDANAKTGDALKSHTQTPSSMTTMSSTFYHAGIQGVLLKDTVVYCAAEKYGLGDLQRISLRKQGLRTGIPVDVILRSARYSYEHTPEQDAKLRAHFLALIIRSRRTFKRSGTMQMEMESGGSKFFFDLFVAMCNHIDDITELTNKNSPRTV